MRLTDEPWLIHAVLVVAMSKTRTTRPPMSSPASLVGLHSFAVDRPCSIWSTAIEPCSVSCMHEGAPPSVGHGENGGTNSTLSFSFVRSCS